MDTKTIDVSDVAELQESFRKALPRAETKVRYGKAIEMMASELYAMRSKGYGWSDIVAMLAEKGLHVTPSTLRNHLSHIKSAGAKAPRGRRAGRARPRESAKPRERRVETAHPHLRVVRHRVVTHRSRPQAYRLPHEPRYRP